MDTLAYQVFGDVYSSAPHGGSEYHIHSVCYPTYPHQPEFCNPISEDSLTKIPHDCFFPLPIDSNVYPNESLDLPEEVVDMFFDYSCSPSSGLSPQSSDSSSSPCTLSSDTMYDLSPMRHHNASENTTSNNPRVLQRKKSNRDASFRYRQKQKARSMLLKNELDAAISSYKRSRLAYEKAEESYNVVQYLLLSLLSPL